MNEEGLRRQDPGHRIRNLRHEPWPGFVPRREFFSKTGEFVEHCCYNPGPRATGQRAERGINGPKTLPEREPASQGWPPEEWALDWREDVIQQDGTVTRPTSGRSQARPRVYRTRKLALRALEVRLTTINSPTYRARPTATFAVLRTGGRPRSLSLHKPGTQSSTRSQLRRWLLPELGACALKDLDGQRLQAFVSRCRCNSKTIRHLVATLRMMWNSARAWGYVARDPFDGLVCPSEGWFTPLPSH